MMRNPITIALIAGSVSLAYGSTIMIDESLSSSQQTKELTEWTSSTNTSLGRGLWNGKGFSFNFSQSAWLSPFVSSPGEGIQMDSQVRLNSITVQTRSSGQSAVSNCYTYLCIINGSTITVQNRSDIFNVPGTNNSSFTFNFSDSATLNTNTTYGIVYSQNGNFAAGNTITLNDGVSIGMARTSTSNTASSEGQLFSGSSLTPGENYAPHVTFSVSQIPEPATAALVFLAGVGFSLRRRRC